jgi:hypothetical protein
LVCGFAIPFICFSYDASQYRKESKSKCMSSRPR